MRDMIRLEAGSLEEGEKEDEGRGLVEEKRGDERYGTSGLVPTICRQEKGKGERRVLATVPTRKKKKG